MKTFEEALHALVATQQGSDESSLLLQNLTDLQAEVISSGMARDFLLTLGSVFFQHDMSHEQILRYARSAFLAGVTVGVEMEKQPLERDPRRDPKPGDIVRLRWPKKPPRDPWEITEVTNSAVYYRMTSSKTGKTYNRREVLDRYRWSEMDVVRRAE